MIALEMMLKYYAIYDPNSSGVERWGSTCRCRTCTWRMNGRN